MKLFRVNSVHPLELAILLLIATMASLYPVLLSADTYQKGQHIEPAFEGWRPNADGTFSFMFGYMNLNWMEEPDVDVGEKNSFSPGDQDRGQPTHFLPRRNRFTFEVEVPADWGDRELVWTLTVNGVERKAYATLKPDYLVDNIVIASETGSLGAGTSSPESRANIPPTLELQGESVRTAKAGEKITLITKVLDDGLPRTNTESAVSQEEFNRSILQPPNRITVDKINGLFLSWNKYRGPGSVAFDPPMPRPWEDTRVSSNSPWGEHWLPPEIPEDGLYEVTATFDEPGTYILWGRADDGGLYHDGYLTVNVVP